MIIELANKLTNKIVDMGVIEKEIEIYKYGIAMLISYSISICIISCITLFTHTYIHSLIYIIAFDKLRSYGGGYHANSYAKCISLFVIFYCIYLIVLLNMDFIPLFLFALLLYVALSKHLPVQHPNKKITENERIVHGKRARLRYIVSLFLSLFLSKFFNIGHAICTVIIIIEILCFFQLYLNKEEIIC